MKREEILKILETWTDANSTDYSECADAILALEQKEQPQLKDAKLLRKVEIKDKADLPSKNGYYIVKDKDRGVNERYYDLLGTKLWWLDKVVWYLQSIEPQPERSVNDGKKTYDSSQDAWRTDAEIYFMNKLEIEEIPRNRVILDAFDIIEMLQEYRSQGMPEVTDEEIKSIRKTHNEDKNKGTKIQCFTCKHFRLSRKEDPCNYCFSLCYWEPKVNIDYFKPDEDGSM